MSESKNTKCLLEQEELLSKVFGKTHEKVINVHFKYVQSVYDDGNTREAISSLFDFINKKRELNLSYSGELSLLNKWVRNEKDLNTSNRLLSLLQEIKGFGSELFNQMDSIILDCYKAQNFESTINQIKKKEEVTTLTPLDYFLLEECYWNLKDYNSCLSLTNLYFDSIIEDVNIKNIVNITQQDAHLTKMKVFLHYVESAFKEGQKDTIIKILNRYNECTENAIEYIKKEKSEATTYLPYLFEGIISGISVNQLENIVRICIKNQKDLSKDFKESIIGRMNGFVDNFCSSAENSVGKTSKLDKKIAGLSRIANLVDDFVDICGKEKCIEVLDYCIDAAKSTGKDSTKFELTILLKESDEPYVNVKESSSLKVLEKAEELYTEISECPEKDVIDFAITLGNLYYKNHHRVYKSLKYYSNARELNDKGKVYSKDQIDKLILYEKQAQSDDKQIKLETKVNNSVNKSYLITACVMMIASIILFVFERGAYGIGAVVSSILLAMFFFIGKIDITLAWVANFLALIVVTLIRIFAGVKFVNTFAVIDIGIVYTFIASLISLDKKGTSNNFGLCAILAGLIISVIEFVLCGFILSWSLWQWIIGVGFGLVSIACLLLAKALGAPFIGIIITSLSFILNLVFYFIFKANYYTIYRIIAIAVLIDAIITCTWAEDEFDDISKAISIVIGIINTILLVILWIHISRVLSAGVFAGVASEATKNTAKTIHHYVGAWWKWPTGIIGALAIALFGLVPGAAWINPILGLVNVYLLTKYGYPGVFDIFFKCFTFGLAISSLLAIFNDKTKLLAKLLSILLGIVCIMVIFNFNDFMSSMI